MKIETAITRILDSDKTPMIKKMKLQSLGFKAIPGSPNQKKVFDALEQFKDVKIEF